MIDSALQEYLGTFDNQGRTFRVIQRGTPFYMLVDETDTVWLDGAPLCSIHEAIFECGYRMPDTESEAWEQRPK